MQEIILAEAPCGQIDNPQGAGWEAEPHWRDRTLLRYKVRRIRQRHTAARQSDLPELASVIAGRRVVPEIQSGKWLRDPNDLSPLQERASCSASQLELALQTAHKAWRSSAWEHVGANGRAFVLDKIAKRLARPRFAEQLALVEARTTGMVVKLSRRMAELAHFAFTAAADYLRRGGLDSELTGDLGSVNCLRKPWGPTLLIAPWNAPAAIGCHKVASALAAGAPCVLKPSEWAQHSLLMIAEAINDCGLPEGTFQLVCGDQEVAYTMVSDRRIKSVSLTGGTRAGCQVGRACADSMKPMQLELGGNNPLIVFPDADLDRAAEGIVYGLCNLNGQWCRGLGRLLVHVSVKKALLERVRERLRHLRLGRSLDDASQMGPLIHEQQYRKVVDAIDRLRSLGGEVVQCTPVPDLPGYFVPPTLVDSCAPQHTTEEIFGPVATIHCFDSEEQALELANGTDYGLAAYVYSSDLPKALRFASRIYAGGVKINGFSLLSLCGEAPRCAWGLSGLGEEGVGQSIEFYTGARVIGVSPQDPVGG